MLELANAVTAEAIEEHAKKPTSTVIYKTVSDYLAQAGPALINRYEAAKAFMLALGDDVQEKTLKYYFAFKRIKNFACVELRTQTNSLILYLKLDPETVEIEKGFTRDVTDIGHFGTGNLEVTIRTDADFERAKYLIQQSYENS